MVYVAKFLSFKWITGNIGIMTDGLIHIIFYLPIAIFANIIITVIIIAGYNKILPFVLSLLFVTKQMKFKIVKIPLCIQLRHLIQS